MKLKKIFSAMTAIIITIIGNTFNCSKANAEETVVWDGSADTSWYDPEETEFHISTPEELAGFMKISNKSYVISYPNGVGVDNYFSGKTVYLDNDIYLNDVSNVENWSSAKPKNCWINGSAFCGIFDGQYHTIYGIYGYPLFSQITGTVKNVILDKGYICKGKENGDYKQGYYGYMGSIAAEQSGNRSLIKNCKNYCDINYNLSGIFTYAGGIVGRGTNIQNCCNYGNITTRVISEDSNSNIDTAGICGSKSKDEPLTIINCYNRGDIYARGTSRSTAYVVSAGIYAGYADFSNDDIIKNCYNSGNILAEGYYISNVNDPINNKNVEKYDIARIFEDCKLTGIQMKDSYTYTENDPYPKLLWEVEIENEKGDINGDGNINIADAVMLQKYLLGNGTLTNWKNADLCEDERIDVFDMVLMRRLLIDKM